MKKYFYLVLTSLFSFLFFSVSTYADKGSFSIYPVKLTQESQKAIILHNFKEEILILGTELKGEKETDVLEFIPFPSEPEVSLAEGNPFEVIKKLIATKKIEIIDRWKTKTKGGPLLTPVEIRFSEKVGLHDVTTIKINNIEGFSSWVKDFLKAKGIKDVDHDRLMGFYNIAEDYIKRGINYFVFDYVSVKQEVKFVEPPLLSKII